MLEIKEAPQAVSKAPENQGAMSDSQTDWLIAWLLQRDAWSIDASERVEESRSAHVAYKAASPQRAYQFTTPAGEKIPATLRGTTPNGDCFFASVQHPGLDRKSL